MNDKLIKILTLDWLASLVNYNFDHNFSDQWIIINIWNGKLSIFLDLRQPNQLKLFNLLPDKYKGCLQENTRKLVNKETLYFNIEELIPIHYPKIISYKLINTTKHKSGSGGWTYISEYFYTYDWEVLLEDNSTIKYHNQSKKMDLDYMGYIYKARIQERNYINFLQQYKAQ